MSQNANLPQVGVKIKKYLSFHHLENVGKKHARHPWILYGVVEAKCWTTGSKSPLLWGFVHEACPGPTAIYPENIPQTSKKMARRLEHTRIRRQSPVFNDNFHKEFRLVKVAKSENPQKNMKLYDHTKWFHAMSNKTLYTQMMGVASFLDSNPLDMLNTQVPADRIYKHQQKHWLGISNICLKGKHMYTYQTGSSFCSDLPQQKTS